MAGPGYIADPHEFVRAVELDGLPRFSRAFGNDPYSRRRRRRRSLAALAERPGRRRRSVGAASGDVSTSSEDAEARSRRGSASSRRRGWCGGHEARAQPRIGPVAFRIGSDLARAARGAARGSTRAIPSPRTDLPISPSGSSPKRLWRRWFRPSVAIRGDYVLPDAAPLSLAHGLLAAEMGMNLQMALGQKRYPAAPRLERREGRAGAGDDRRIRHRQIDSGGAARRARLAADGRRIRPARPRRAAGSIPFRARSASRTARSG